nr:MFS transporter [Gordonia sp. NB41Y]
MWIVALMLGIIGIFAAWFGPLQILLPEQSRDIADDAGIGKESLLATVTGVGALVSMIANPLWGLLSDRTRSRWGRRIPVAVAGTVVGVAGLLVLSSAHGLAAMVAGWALVQAGFNGPFAAFTALIADQVPEDERGLVGSMFGVGQIVGVVLGTVAATVVGPGPLGYVALAVAAPALISAVIVVQLGNPRTESARGPSSAGGWTFRLTRDFAWAWAMRCAMNMVNAIVMLYLFYYLSDEVGIADPAGQVLLVTVVNVLLSAAAAAVGGIWSDRIARRRSFVIAGAVGVGLGTAVLGGFATWSTTIVAAVLVGLGWGLYLAVDIAIVTATLPDDESAATMLGVANIASSLPQVLAPLIAAPVVTSALGYPGFYGLGVVAAVIAVVCVRRITVIR